MSAEHDAALIQEEWDTRPGRMARLEGEPVWRDMEPVTLTGFELRIAEVFAQERRRSSQAHGYYWTRETRHARDVNTVDAEGVAAELAFCKAFNTYPDFRLAQQSADIPAWDCVVAGLRVDVKQTPHKTGRLIVPDELAHNVKHPDWYYLVIGAWPGPFKMAGGLSHSEMMAQPLRDFGRGKAYYAEQSTLRCPFQAWRWVR